MPGWDAKLYLKFGKERTQPCIDLIHRIEIASPARIADLGCGPGNSTEALRQHWPDATLIGIDSSVKMIEAARETYPSGTWQVGDAAAWVVSDPFDLVFSNAMLQWLPNHAALCRRLLAQVRSGGALAVQMPAHYDSPLHREMIEVSKDPAWNDRMHSARTSLTSEPPWYYYEALQSLASRIDIWETIYQHIVTSPDAILEWFRATGLRPYLDALKSEAERLRFEQMLLERYRASYPRRTDGNVLFPFRRLFFVAYSL